jgi:hypothetical protein
MFLCAKIGKKSESTAHFGNKNQQNRFKISKTVSKSAKSLLSYHFALPLMEFCLPLWGKTKSNNKESHTKISYHGKKKNAMDFMYRPHLQSGGTGIMLEGRQLAAERAGTV